MATIAPPPKPPNPVLIDSEGYIDQQISRTRRSLKLLDLAAGVMTLMIGLLGFILVGAVIDQWIVPGGLGPIGRTLLFSVMLLGVLWYGWRQFLPLLKPINPVYAAQTIERNAPTLKNSLLNLLLFRSHRDYLSARVYHALEQQAAQRLSTSAFDAAVDRTALLRLGYALVLIVAVCALYAVLSPKNLALSAARVMAPWTDLTAPSRVQILDVKPGKTSVARGERVAVSAEINGLNADEPVTLLYSTADERTVGETIRMQRPTPQSRRFVATLPRGTDAGVEQDLSYWIEAGDARSRKFKLSVFTRPTIIVQKVRYEYPAYTGIPSKETDHTGDIRGVEGTRVTISALASQPIKSANVDLKADGSNDLAMTPEGDRAMASFVLKLRDDRRTPVDPEYMLRFTSVDGRTNSDPPTYSIEVTPDYGPEVRITEPEAPEQVARLDEIVPVGVEARDPDYALSSVNIVGKVDGGEERVLIEMITKPHSRRLGATRMLTPGDIGMKPGEVLEYWAEARDNRPEPNIAFSEHRRIKVIGPNKPPQGQQPPQGQGKQQPDGQEPGDQGEDGGQGGGMAGGNEGESGGSGEGEQQGAGGTAGGQGQSGQKSENSEGANGESGGENNSGESNEGSEEAGENGAGGASGAGSDDSNEQSQENGEQGNRAGGAGQKGQQKQEPSEANSESDEAGEADEAGEPQAGGESGSGKVSSAGDNDREAFQKMSEILNPEGQDQTGAGKPGEQQPGNAQQQADGDPTGENAEGAQRTEGQPGAQQQNNSQTGQQQEGATAGEPNAGEAGQEGNAGENAQTPPDDSTGAAGDSQKATGQKPPAEGAQPQGAGEQAGDTEQQAPAAGDNPSAREGADKPREAKPGDGANEDPQQGEQPSPDGAMNQDNGNSGAGHSTGEEQGTPGSDGAMRQGKEKREGDNRQAMDDQEPPAGSPNNKKESDSDGGQSGDQSGGGGEGAGQPADAAGKGGAGQHEAADEGAGRAEEQGEGETGTKAGDQQLTDGKTGQSSGGQAGQGSQQGDAGEQESQSPPDESGQQGESEGSQSSEGGKPGSQQGQPSKPSGAEQSPAGESGEPGSQDSSAGESPQGQPGAPPSAGEPSSPNSPSDGNNPSDKPSDQKPSTQSPAGAAQPMGGGAGSNAASSSSGGVEPEPADQANLDYARQQTDLVLERIDSQLAKKKVDPKLLKSLGWSEAELQRFVDRWKNLKSRAEDADEASQELDEALRSLGLRRDAPIRFKGTAKADDLRANDALRSKPPSDYADRVREYSKAISSQNDN